MLFCKKCARILDEDLNQCPYCGSLDDSIINDENVASEYDVANLKEIVIPESGFAENDNQEEQRTAEPDQIFETSGGSAPKPAEETIQPEIVEATPYYGGQYRHEKVDGGEDSLSLVVKIAIIISCMVFPIGGIIAAIVFMNKKEIPYRSFGQILLIIMLVEIIFGALCCCIFANAAYLTSA